MMNTMLAKHNINIFMCEIIIFFLKRYLFMYLAVSCSLQDLSSMTRDWTVTPLWVEAESHDHWTTREIPHACSCIPQWRQIISLVGNGKIRIFTFIWYFHFFSPALQSLLFSKTIPGHGSLTCHLETVLSRMTLCRSENHPIQFHQSSNWSK